MARDNLNAACRIECARHIFANLSWIAFAEVTKSSSCFSSCSREALRISVSLMTFVLLERSCLSWTCDLENASAGNPGLSSRILS